MAKKTKKRRKSRSAAQKRASKRNIKKAQSSRRKKKGKTKRKINKPKRKSTNKKMAGKGKKTFIDKIPLLKNKTVQRIAFGLGIGLVVVKIIDLAAGALPEKLAAPLVQNKRIIQLGVEAVTEPLSAAVDIVTGGGLSNLSSLLPNKQQSAVANGGFA